MKNKGIQRKIPIQTVIKRSLELWNASQRKSGGTISVRMNILWIQKTQNCGKQLEVYAEEKFMLIDPLESERNRCCFEWNHPLGKAAIALAI